MKEHLEADEYIQLLKTPCYHEEVREAFIFSCYTGLRRCDIKVLDWIDIKGDQLKTRIFQEKTDEPLVINLHPIAKAILEKRKCLIPLKLENCFSIFDAIHYGYVLRCLM